MLPPPPKLELEFIKLADTITTLQEKKRSEKQLTLWDPISKIQNEGNAKKKKKKAVSSTYKLKEGKKNTYTLRESRDISTNQKHQGGIMKQMRNKCWLDT